MVVTYVRTGTVIMARRSIEIRRLCLHNGAPTPSTNLAVLATTCRSSRRMKSESSVSFAMEADPATVPPSGSDARRPAGRTAAGTGERARAGVCSPAVLAPLLTSDERARGPDERAPTRQPSAADIPTGYASPAPTGIRLNGLRRSCQKGNEFKRGLPWAEGNISRKEFGPVSDDGRRSLGGRARVPTATLALHVLFLTAAATLCARRRSFRTP
jgi:hypothetical protein